MESVCPNCGLDLLPVPRRVQQGSLVLTRRLILWKRRRVLLSPQGFLLVRALVRSRCRLSWGALAEVIGAETAENPNRAVYVQVSRARRSFKAVDPSFSAMRTVWGEGLIWQEAA